jgi:S-DNA-T family DNA segregation ATPase FtsK/SpoIIIE
MLLFPLLTVVASVAFVVYSPSPLFLVIAGLLILGSIGFAVVVVVQSRSGQRRRARRDRSRYTAYLDGLDGELTETARLQDLAARFVHPGLVELWAIACQRVRVWERAPAHLDFATVRVGAGDVPLATPLRLEGGDDPLTERDPAALAGARRLIDEHALVADQPIVLDLRARPSVSFVGPRSLTRPLARAIVMELAVFCAPDDLLLAICHPPDSAADWEFAKWLPHLVLEDGPALLCDDGERLAAMLAEEVAQRRDRARRRAGMLLDESGLIVGPSAEPDPVRHLLLVVDGYEPGTTAGRSELVADLAQRAGDLAASVVVLVEAQRDEPRTVNERVLVVPGHGLTASSAEAGTLQGRPEGAEPVLSEVTARLLTSLRLAEHDPRAVLSETWRLADLLDIDDLDDLRPERAWRERPARDQLRVPLGMGADGEPVVLDLKEPALGGMGPHGLVVGATGSGKSELLRTLTTGLAVTHPPELLSMVLVDFKGGATFAGMADLPQVAGVITNLQDDLALVDRVHDALMGEQLRRQELLRRAGNLDSIRQYHRLRAAGADLEPLPFLLVIVDEFGELLSNRPDFIDLFVGIGRVGRSLGVHLLLASQRLDEGRLRGLESHLSYRIALRVFNSIESRAVIGVPDAYTLPSAPGSAYLKIDADAPRRFRVASVSTLHERPAPVARSSAPSIELFTGRAPAPSVIPGPAGVAPPTAGSGETDAPGASTVQVVVERLRGAAPRVHQVWLPPLERVLTLDMLLSTLTVDPVRGVTAAGWPGAGQLRVPLGLDDRPREQAKQVLVADFAGETGHLAVVGAPQTGKSTLLRTLVVAFALTHTPAEVQFYGIDFGGGGLQTLEGLPHVGTICARFDLERARRVIGELGSLIDRRERFFRAAGIDSMATFRTLRASDAPQKELFGDVFLLIDNWAAVRHELEDLEAPVLDIGARGLGYGVHLVITANRWMEVHSALRDNIAGRLELRLNEPLDSEVDRRLAAQVPVGVSGRGLTPGRLLFQAALPRVDGRATAAGLQASLDDLVRRIAGGWTGPAAPPARVLPRQLPAEALPAPGGDAPPGVPIGVSEPALDLVALDLRSGDPHFVVFGDTGSGKSGFCRTYLDGLVARSSPDTAAVAVVDYRRTLLDAVPDDFLWGYAGGAPAAVELVARLTALLAARQPGPGLTAAELRARTWWTGPDVYVVVDDYDLVGAPGTFGPLVPLLDFLAQGRDLGLHVVLTHRSGGASRAQFEPVVQRLRDLNTPGILLSGDRLEGPLIGPQAPALQPAGRGFLVRRQEPTCLVQIAWTPPHGGS